jgi:hypothetical protein
LLALGRIRSVARLVSTVKKRLVKRGAAGPATEKTLGEAPGRGRDQGERAWPRGFVMVRTTANAPF